VTYDLHSPQLEIWQIQPCAQNGYFVVSMEHLSVESFVHLQLWIDLFTVHITYLQVQEIEFFWLLV